jgi:hypothetical protein
MSGIQTRPFLTRGKVAFALAFLVLVIIVAGRAPFRTMDALFVSDGFGYYVYLPSVFMDGDLDLSNQLARQEGQVEHEFYQVIPRTGLPGNPFQIGCALLWMPFFLAAHGVLTGLHHLGLNVPTDGFGYAYEFPVYCGAFLYGYLGLYFLWRLLQDLWDDRVATVTTVALALGTSVAAYLWFEPDFSHIASMALISILFYYLQRIGRAKDLRWQSWAGLGALSGLIAEVRATDVVVGIAIAWVGLGVLQESAATLGARRWRAAAQCIGAFTLTAFVVFLPQLLVWKVIYGSYVLVPSGTNYEQMAWTHPDLGNFLFGSTRGLFTWTPLALFAAAGLVLGLFRGPRIVQCAAVVYLVALYFNSSIPRWYVGCNFGAPRIVNHSVALALGLGYLISLRPAVAFSRPVLALGLALICFNWILMVRYFTHGLPEYGYVSWHNLYVETLEFPVRKVTGRLLSCVWPMGVPGA